MRTLNVDSLVERVREITDLKDTQFVTDDEIGHYLNRAYKSLYNEIVEANEDYFTKTIRFRSITNELVLPLDFYKLRAIDLYYGNFFYTLSPVALRERESYQFSSSFYRPYNVRGCSDLYRYNIEGDKITFYSQLRGSESDFIMHYVPKPKTLGEGARLPEGWENYIILKAAVMCRVKEESSYRELAMLAEEELNRVRKLCVERDHTQPETIIDVNEEVAPLSYGELGAQLLSSLEGVTENTLLPYMGVCPYPDFIEEEGYELRHEHIFLMSHARSVFMLTTKPGLTGKYGSWVVCDARRDTGYIWSSANSNPGFVSDGAVRTYIRAHQAIALNIDPQIYLDDVNSKQKRCLFYSEAGSYNVHLPEPALFPRVGRVTLRPPGTDVPPRVELPPTTPPGGGPASNGGGTTQARAVNVYLTYLDPGVSYTAADVTNGSLPNAVDGALETSRFGKGSLPSGQNRGYINVVSPRWSDEGPNARPRYQLVVVTGGARIIGYFPGGFRGINQLAALDYLGSRGGNAYYRTSARLLVVVSGTTKEFEVRVDGANNNRESAS